MLDKLPGTSNNASDFGQTFSTAHVTKLKVRKVQANTISTFETSNKKNLNNVIDQILFNEITVNYIIFCRI